MLGIFPPVVRKPLDIFVSPRHKNSSFLVLEHKFETQIHPPFPLYLISSMSIFLHFNLLNPAMCSGHVYIQYYKGI